MARKLKTYQTSLGFFDEAIAAPSMKAALEAWGADSNLFHQGAATESDDRPSSPRPWPNQVWCSDARLAPAVPSASMLNSQQILATPANR
jgi:hypothetical protein